MHILKIRFSLLFRQALSVVVLALLFSSCVTRQIEKDLVRMGEKNNYFRGFVVYDVQKNKEIINYNGNKYFTPASNTKLFTFYTAYKTFGDSVPGLYYSVRPDSLIIKGAADPSLLYGFDESKTLDFLRAADKNIYLVDADIDEPAFGPGWAWDDYTYYYMPEKNLFPVYGNLVTMSKKGDSIQVRPEFFRRDIEHVEEKLPRRAINENTFFVQKNSEFTDRKIPFKTSNQLTADLLGAEIGKKIVVIEPEKDLTFKTFYSVSYDSLYKEMLHVSDNFIAEQLMLQVAHQVDTVYAVDKAIDYSLENYLKGIPQQPRWVDGSGLSRYNLFTPEDLVFLLKKIYKEVPHDKLFAYLPAGGHSGTLKKYYKNEQPYIFAKSGTLSNNYNLSGFLITKKGKVLIFSFMNNHYQGSSVDRKKEMEQYFLKLYSKY